MTAAFDPPRNNPEARMIAAAQRLATPTPAPATHVAVDALNALAGFRVFVTSREKAKHPEGAALFDKAIETLRAALAAPHGEAAAPRIPWLGNCQGRDCISNYCDPATGTTYPCNCTPAPTRGYGEAVNHDEALQLAYMKRGESNLARCYIELATHPPAAQPEIRGNGEAVAWQVRHHIGKAWSEWSNCPKDMAEHLQRRESGTCEIRALYAAPPAAQAGEGERTPFEMVEEQERNARLRAAREAAREGRVDG